jgi:1-acyl-sn-glycerol-3-phosphate acyltransferase
MTYWVLKAVLTPVLRFFYRVRVDGIEQVPPNGPVILASNHRSFSDSVFLPLVLRRRLTFVAKAEYFDDPRKAWFLRALGQIPVERTGGPAGRRALASARHVLEAGGMFGIYPEGTRSPDGRLYRGHTGVARLALDTGAPVLAVAMIGTAETQPIGRVRPRLFMPITVRFSRPLTFDRYGDRDDPRILRRVTDEIMFELSELSGQEYASEYAPGRDPVEALAPDPAGVASAARAEPIEGFEPFVAD